MRFLSLSRNAITLAVFACLTIAPAAYAQTLVVPNAYAATEGNRGLTTLVEDGARTYQEIVDASQLTPLLGQNLTGVTYRIDAAFGTTFPSSPVTFGFYNIYLGTGVAVNSASTTYADNYIGVRTQVRGGALTIPANAFVNNGPASPFGTTISFDTPYLYTGGNLVFEVRHPGNGTQDTFLDAIDATGAGYGTTVSGQFTQNDPNATTAAVTGAATILRLSYASVPEPGSMALLAGMGTVGAASLRRRKNARKAAQTAVSRS